MYARYIRYKLTHHHRILLIVFIAWMMYVYGYFKIAQLLGIQFMMLLISNCTSIMFPVISTLIVIHLHPTRTVTKVRMENTKV